MQGSTANRSGLRNIALWVLMLLLLASTGGCSVKHLAVTSVGNAMAESGEVYASEEDIEFAGAAIPFGLKTIEGLLVEVPDHRGLLLSAASGFTQYAYAYVELPAKRFEDTDYRLARAERLRAKRMYLRGRGYALTALSGRRSDFKQELLANPQQALAAIKTAQVPELYWATVSWAAAIAADKEDMEMVADLHLIEPMIERCLQLNEGYDNGAIHEFMISFEAGRGAAQGGSIDAARSHYQRAMSLAEGRKISAMVNLAEAVTVQEQNRVEFEALLIQALAFDVNTAPEFRLANLIAQQRAAILLAQIDDLFIEG